MNVSSFRLTLDLDEGVLLLNAGESMAQADDPHSWLTLENAELYKIPIVVEILEKLVEALKVGHDGIDLTVEGRYLRKGALIDLNRASDEELQTLPGVGPGLASAIIQGRDYGRVEDLADVPGIGSIRLAEIRPLVRVGM